MVLERAMVCKADLGQLRGPDDDEDREARRSGRAIRKEMLMLRSAQRAVSRRNVHLGLNKRAGCEYAVQRRLVQVPTTVPTAATVRSLNTANSNVNVKRAGYRPQLQHRAYASLTSTPTSENAGIKAMLGVLDDVSRLQRTLGETDINYVARVDSARVALENERVRITVVGDSGVDTRSIVDALLSDGSPTVTSTGSGTGDQMPVTRFSFGSTAETSNTNAELMDAKVPVGWLSANDFEIFHTPVASRMSSDRLADILHRTDLIVLVTDLTRRLSTEHEKQFIRDFYLNGRTASSLVVVVDGMELVPDQPQKLAIVDEIQQNLRTLLSSSQTVTANDIPSVIPVSTRAARSELPAVLAKHFATGSGDIYTASGLPALQSTVISRVDTARDRARLKLSTAAFSATQALNHLLTSHAAAQSVLSHITDDLQVLVDRVVSTEKRLVREYESRDLGVVEKTFTALSDAIRAYFASARFWKLFWKSETVGSDLQRVVRDHSLVQSEYQMVYAIGKMNEGLVQLYERVQESLQKASHSCSQDACLDAVKRLNEDLRRGIVSLEARSPVTGEADPFILRNPVAQFDTSYSAPHCKALQEVAQKLVARQMVYQLGIFFTLAGVTHLGVPFAAVGLPVSILASTTGLVWMNMRWKRAEERFWAGVSAGFGRLRENLVSTYRQEFQRTVAAPLVSVVQTLEQSLQLSQKQLEKGRSDVRETLDRVGWIVADGKGR